MRTTPHCEVCDMQMVRTPKGRGWYCPLRNERNHKQAAESLRLRREIEMIERTIGGDR